MRDRKEMCFDYFFKIFVICKYTFIEIIKSKILIMVLLLGMAQLLICYVAYSFTYGVPERIALDFGLGTLSLSSVGIAIFMGVGLISKEVESRTIYMILSRPIDRNQFLIGKMLGMIAIMFLNVLCLGVLALLLYLFLGGSLNLVIISAIFFSFLEAVIVLSVVVFFSLITNNTLSVIYGILIYILGHSINDTLINTVAAKGTALITYTLKGYYFLFPNFNRLNLKDYVLYQSVLETSQLMIPVLYATAYVLFILGCATLLFSRKNID